MTHNSIDNSSPTRNRGKQPPFEIVLDEGCSIVCDDVPDNCTIRVLQMDGRNPPRLSPASKWVEDYPPGSPVSPPHDQFPIRSRRSIVESVRRNMQENNGGGSTRRGIHGRGEAEQDVFALRKPYCKYDSQRPFPTQLATPAAFYSSSTSRQSCPSSPPSAATDRLLNSKRAQMHFTRTNIEVGGTDLHEMHSNSGAAEARPPPASLASPPSPLIGGRCCGMAEYNPSHFRSETLERASSRDVSPSGDVFRSRPVSAGVICSHHELQPCPARAGSYCRANRAGQGNPPRSPGLSRTPSCKFHDNLPCPALAGLPCRGEMQMTGTSPSPSRSSSPIPGSSPSSPPSPSPDESSSQQGTPSGSSGVCYPPRTIAPPPKSPRSRTPHRTAPEKRGAGP